VLDDPLSALDPAVAGKLFRECIIGFLADRTRVLVTNNLGLLPKCDQVLVMDKPDGAPATIAEQGRYSMLVRAGLDFARLMDGFHGSSEHRDRR